MQLLSSTEVERFLRKGPSGWIPYRGATMYPSYGCGKCARPLVIGMSIHALNYGHRVNDGPIAYGTRIRCPVCGTVNSTNARVLKYLSVNELLLDSIEDAENCLQDPITKYKMIRMAALLRRLLKDGGEGILQKANRWGVELVFRVNQPRMEPVSPSLDLLLPDDLFPGTATYNQSINLNKKQFLSFEAMKIGGFSVTVGALINYVNYIEGGIHAGYPKDDLDIALIERSGYLMINGLPFWAAALPAIGRVVIEAAAPLRQLILMEMEAE